MTGVDITSALGLVAMLLFTAWVCDADLLARRLWARWRSHPEPTPGVSADDWCPGCDRIVPAGQMGWGEDGDYRCGACLGITTAGGAAEIQVQLDVLQELGVFAHDEVAGLVPLRVKVPPILRQTAAYKSGTVPLNALPKLPRDAIVPPKPKRRVCSCPDCVAFGPREDHREPVPPKWPPIPEGTPSMEWKATELHAYLMAFDPDVTPAARTKREMLSLALAHHQHGDAGEPFPYGERFGV